ncbi:MAG: O-antigen ligase family protein [Gemmatimonadaceae bacterium]|nr:O-antigen ligase family protein [Gemmatimonadaceae bacterium]
MRPQAEGGWRSARWRGGNAAPALGDALPPLPPITSPPEPSPVPPAAGTWRGRWRSRQGEATPAQAGGTAGWFGAFPRIEDAFKWPWQGVDWSLGYVAFLLYIFVVTSYLVNLGQVAIVAAVIGVTFSKTEKWKFPLPMVLMALFLVIVAIGFRASPFGQKDWKPFEDMVKVFVITLVSLAVLTNRARIRFYLFYYLALYALFPVRGGIFNWFVYRAATQGRVAWNHAFENPNDMAALLMLPLGLCVALVYTERLKLIRNAALIGIAAIPMIIFMTQSRGAIVAIGATVLVYFLVQGKGRAKTIFSLLAVAVVVGVFAPSGVWERLGSLKAATEAGDLTEANDSRSAEQRFEIWKVAWQVHEEWPIIGVGWGSYPYAHAFYSRRQAFKRIAGGARDAHNTYLTVLGETGYLGFFLWTAMIGAVVVPGIAAMRRVRSYSEEYANQLKMLLLALLCFGLAGMFGTFAHVTFTYTHLALILAAAQVATKEVDDYEQGRAGPRIRAARA